MSLTKTNIFHLQFSNERAKYFRNVSLVIIVKCLSDKSALPQLMPWHRLGTRASVVAMITSVSKE